MSCSSSCSQDSEAVNVNFSKYYVFYKQAGKRDEPKAEPKKGEDDDDEDPNVVYYTPVRPAR